MALPAVCALNGLEASSSPNDGRDIIRALVDHYRCPAEFLDCELSGPLSTDSGYFRFGPDAICYGRTSNGYRTPDAGALLYGALHDLETVGSTLRLPFNPTEVIDNLRLERYAHGCKPNEWGWGERRLRDAYYAMRPYLGVKLRKHLQRAYTRDWRRIAFPRWPIDTSVEQISEALLRAAINANGVAEIPFVWFWPNGAKGCVVLTHDVEDQRGHQMCSELIDIDNAHGFRASFQFVPEGTYHVSEALTDRIRDRGFEVNLQDLNHDGYLFADREEFLRRAAKINSYGEAYGAKGFRAAVMYRNLSWYDALNFSYDMSVPNVAHLDPQRGGCCTVFPYFVGEVLEIPLTTTQDYMLFHLLGDHSLELWKSQVDTILKNHGLMSILVHPDYVGEQKARQTYCELLDWLRNLSSQEGLWCALPGEVDEWWRSRSRMRVVQRRGEWQIEGPGSERAMLATARIADDQIEYHLSSQVGVTLK
jgi:hypothetical protein